MAAVGSTLGVTVVLNTVLINTVLINTVVVVDVVETLHTRFSELKMLRSATWWSTPRISPGFAKIALLLGMHVERGV